MEFLMAELRKNGFALFIAAVAVATLLVITFFPGGSLIEGFKAHRDIRQWEKQMTELNSEIDQMQKQIDQLRSDPDTLEKFARENFQFAAPGDDVYIIGR